MDATELTQRLDFVDMPDGSVTAALTVALPNGRSRVFRTRVDDIDLEELAAVFRSAERPIIGVSAPGAAEWFWTGVVAASLGKNPAWGKDGEAWWQSLGSDKREALRAQLLAMQAGSPARGKDPKRDLAWWESLGKDKRQSLRRRYTGDTSLLGTITSAAKSVVSSPVAMAINPLGALATKHAIDNPEQTLSLIPGGAAAGAGAKAALKLAATTKLMQGAAKQLESTSKPLAATLDTTGRLAAAKLAGAAGAKNAQLSILQNARQATSKLPAAVAKSVMDAATSKANKAKALAEQPSATDVLAHARAGKVRSNKGGKVNAAELRKAAKAGRVFFVER